MNNYKPYAYLYKRVTEPSKLLVRFITQIPAGMKLTLREGDPFIGDHITLLRYSIEEDQTIHDDRKEEFEQEFNWDGKLMAVQITIGSGMGNTGGSSVISSDMAERV